MHIVDDSYVIVQIMFFWVKGILDSFTVNMMLGLVSLSVNLGIIAKAHKNPDRVVEALCIKPGLSIYFILKCLIYLISGKNLKLWWQQYTNIQWFKRFWTRCNIELFINLNNEVWMNPGTILIRHSIYSKDKFYDKIILYLFFTNIL